MSFVKKRLDKKKGRFCMFYNINIVISFTLTKQEIPLISIGVLL